jgi:putative glutamine amidotransferase
MSRPRIAIVMDENTSTDASRYEAHKGYFRGVHEAGGLPFGIPFLTEMVETVPRDFDALMVIGGRFAYPDDWYVDGERSRASHSDRFAMDAGLIGEFMEQDKPILGICAGMQALACLNGCRLNADIGTLLPGALEHDKAGLLHPIRIATGTLLHQAVGTTRMKVNSFHREAVVEMGSGVVASAHALDAVVEAIEIDGMRFAIGLQWHQERFVGLEHEGNAIFNAFVGAC